MLECEVAMRSAAGFGVAAGDGEVDVVSTGAGDTAGNCAAVTGVGAAFTSGCICAMV